MVDCLRGRFRRRSPRAYLGIAGGPTTVLCPWRRFRRRSPWACHGVARGTPASQFLWWGLRWRSSRKQLYFHERMIHQELRHIAGVQLQIYWAQKRWVLQPIPLVAGITSDDLFQVFLVIFSSLLSNVLQLINFAARIITFFIRVLFFIRQLAILLFSDI